MDELFKIYRVEKEEAEKIFASSDVPHIHDYEELLVGMEGQLEHFVDFTTVTYEAPYISFIPKGKLHRLKPLVNNGNCSIWVIRWRTEFLTETSFQLYANYSQHSNLKLNNDKGFSRITVLCEMLSDEMESEDSNMSVVHDLLQALFSIIEAERERVETISNIDVKTPNSIFSKFLKVLEVNFRNQTGVEFYAEQLSMSSRNLNNICQNVMHRSVSELIEERRLAEGRKLLVSTDMTVSEIGFDLGYNEKSCFTTVFKKKSGQTPTAFRKEMRRILS
jgi:AraC family transcriptional regulator, transcriptional activator of pobA